MASTAASGAGGGGGSDKQSSSPAPSASPSPPGSRIKSTAAASLAAKPASVPPRDAWPAHASSLLRSFGRADKLRRRRILERTIASLEKRQEARKKSKKAGDAGEAIEFYRYVLGRVGAPKGSSSSGGSKKSASVAVPSYAAMQAAAAATAAPIKRGPGRPPKKPNSPPPPPLPQEEDEDDEETDDDSDDEGEDQLSSSSSSEEEESSSSSEEEDSNEENGKGGGSKKGGIESEGGESDGDKKPKAKLAEAEPEDAPPSPPPKRGRGRPPKSAAAAAAKAKGMGKAKTKNTSGKSGNGKLKSGGGGEDDDSASTSSALSLTSEAFLAQHNDLCEVCTAPGELLCCATCNLVFHMECARPVMKIMPPDDWSCAFCVNTGITGHKSGSRERKRASRGVSEMGRLQQEHKERRVREEKAREEKAREKREEEEKARKKREEEEKARKKREEEEKARKRREEEERARKRREEEERARKWREEEERKKREEVERKKREEVERKAREEKERKAREEKERKAREDEEKKARAKAEADAAATAATTAATASTKTMAPSVTSTPPKRKRGRPRKHPLSSPPPGGEASSVSSAPVRVPPRIPSSPSAPARKELHNLLDTLTPELDVRTKNRGRRQRKAPTLFDPQACPASEWRDEEERAKRASLETLEAEKNGSGPTEEGKKPVAGAEKGGAVGKKKEDGEPGKTSEGKVRVKKMSKKKKKKKKKRYLDKGDDEPLVPVKRKRGRPPSRPLVNCTFCNDDDNVKVCCFCACRVCFNKHAKGHTLLCDGCDAEYHTFCLTPPLKEIPKDAEWYCPVCTGEVDAEDEEEDPPGDVEAAVAAFGAAETKTATIAASSGIDEPESSKKMATEKEAESPRPFWERVAEKVASEAHVKASLQKKEKDDIADLPPCDGTAAKGGQGDVTHEKSSAHNEPVVPPNRTTSPKLPLSVLGKTSSRALSRSGTPVSSAAGGDKAFAIIRSGRTPKTKALFAEGAKPSGTASSSSSTLSSEPASKKRKTSSGVAAAVAAAKGRGGTPPSSKEAASAKNGKSTTSSRGQHQLVMKDDEVPAPGSVCDDGEWYSTYEDETLSQVAAKAGCHWSDLAGLKENTHRYGKRLAAHTKFKEGTLLCILLAASSSTGRKRAKKSVSAPAPAPSPLPPEEATPVPPPGERSEDGIWYSTFEDETLSKVAAKVGREWGEIAVLAENTERYGKRLLASTKFKVGTLLRIPEPASRPLISKEKAVGPSDKEKAAIVATTTLKTAGAARKPRQPPVSSVSDVSKDTGLVSSETPEVNPSDAVKSAPKLAPAITTPAANVPDAVLPKARTLSPVAPPLETASAQPATSLTKTPASITAQEKQGPTITNASPPAAKIEASSDRSSPVEQQTNIPEESGKTLLGASQEGEVLSPTTSRSGRTVKRSSFFDDIKEGEQHLRSDLRALGETGKINAKAVQEKERATVQVPSAPHSSSPSVPIAPQKKTPPHAPAAPKPSILKPTQPIEAVPKQAPIPSSLLKEPKSVQTPQTLKRALVTSVATQKPHNPAARIASIQKTASGPLSISITVARPTAAASASATKARPAPAMNSKTPSLTPQSAPKAVALPSAKKRRITCTAGPAPLNPASIAAAAAANAGIPLTPQVKQPRRKPGARECMQISRRFGANVIPQRYMDILLDYCSRGKVEHLIRMRERLDDHSRFLELQLAGLESLVQKNGELTVTVPPAEPEPERIEETKPPGGTGGPSSSGGGSGTSGLGGAGGLSAADASDGGA